MSKRVPLLPSQKNFLLSKVPGFREAQKNSVVPAFLSIVYLEWFERWPVEAQGAFDAAASSDGSSDSSESVDELTAARKSMMKVSRLSTLRKEVMLTLCQRIKNWFYNSRVGKVQASERPVVIDLTKGARRVLQPYQAYLKLYNDKLRTTVEKRYQAKLREVRQGDKLPNRLGVIVEVAKENLEKEPAAVKAEVEHYRLYRAVDEETDDKEKARKRY